MQEQLRGCLGSYESLVRSFLEVGYKTILFDQIRGKAKQLILRHDVDFDCDAALELAEIEAQLQVKATYFFLVANDSYNLFSPLNREAVQAIHALGHRIEIHFDPTAYKNPEQGLKNERDAFEAWFGVKTRIISVHRPSAEFLKNTAAFATLEHTYLPKYFSDITYVADSRGAFRYGHPLTTDAFANHQSFQLLTHPIWWILKGSSNREVLTNMIQARQADYSDHVERNCTPFVS